MKNKGFTLIELLGVIVILALLSVIIVPSVVSNIQKGNKNADEDTKEAIILSARNWLSDNKEVVTGSSYTISVSTLQNEGYLDKNITLPSKGCTLENASVTITVTQKTNNTKYDYKYNEASDCK